MQVVSADPAGRRQRVKLPSPRHSLMAVSKSHHKKVVSNRLLNNDTEVPLSSQPDRAIRRQRGNSELANQPLDGNGGEIARPTM